VLTFYPEKLIYDRQTETFRFRAIEGNRVVAFAVTRDALTDWGERNNMAGEDPEEIFRCMRVEVAHDRPAEVRGDGTQSRGRHLHR
jgi:hypothetical protein